jgi:type I restriction enzyme M protein
MLTVAEETLQGPGPPRRAISIHLYGQEINPRPTPSAKADMLLKGEGRRREDRGRRRVHSTLSHDAFPAEKFDFMLSNPPYGKSWKKDLDAPGRQGWHVAIPASRSSSTGAKSSPCVTRSSDGQLLFLANMASKMRPVTDKAPLGSRIAEVHNGSSLFTGDAGQGESNLRRWIIENDWLEAIVALPLNLFYNTGIATYIWVLTNRKPPSGRARCSSSTPRAGASPCARTWARRTASCRGRTSSAC